MSKLGKILTVSLPVLSGLFSWYASIAQMEFVQNKGQWHNNVQYRGDFTTGSFFLEKKGFTVLLNDPKDVLSLSEMTHGDYKSGKEVNNPGSLIFHSFAYKVNFLGAADYIQSIPDKPLSTYNNYFIGNNPRSWAGDCKIYQGITYKNVYPNIDVRYYSDAEKLKYDFIIHPGGNVSSIAMQYDGPLDINVKDKQLNIITSVSTVKELSPYSYQSLMSSRQEVDCKYVVRNNVVTFRVGNYDPKETLIIDPTIVFSSFTGSRADNWGYTATPGPDGSFFAGGIAFDAGYPVSPGAYQTTFAGGENDDDNGSGYDIAIFKFSPNGSSRIYATYFGGNKNEQPHSMISDAAGNLIVAGRTSSSANSFPTTIPQIGSGGGYDIFVAKFNATGTQLIGSVKMGGNGNDGVNIRGKYNQPEGADATRRNYGDDARSEVILDAAENVFLVSCTQSTNFPATPATPIQPTFGGGRQDGVIVKFNPTLSTVLFSTFFGGSGDDACFVASISPLTGNLFVAGGTTSNSLPGIRPGVLYPSFKGGETDGFVSEIVSDGSAVVRTTYMGTSGNDLVYGIQFDKLGFPYIMGTTTGTWPVLNARSFGPGGDNGKQFISKLKADLSGFVYSTVFGTASAIPNISPVAFLVDRCENVYVSGWGGGINSRKLFPSAGTSGMPEVNPLTGIPPADGADFYFFVLEKNGQNQLFGSHFGQFGGLGDHVDGGTSRFDANGVIYQAICANCGHGASFPSTPGVWSPDNASVGCNEAAVKIIMNFAGVGAGLQTLIDAVVNKRSGCIPLTVIFKDTLHLGKKFYWDFGDGSPQVSTTSFDTSHTYTTVGNFRVRLIAEDITTCNQRDTAYVTIRAGDNVAHLDFNMTKKPPCESLTMIFTNTSTPTRGSFGPGSFYWDFGDGSPLLQAGLTTYVEHTYAAVGNYIVRLLIDDTTFCNSPDELSKILRLNAFVKARFTTPAVGCVPYDGVFTNTSLAGTDFKWEWGDGTFSFESTTEVHHFYPNVGTYPVRLIAMDTSTCNKIDTSAYQTITVVSPPTAGFTWQPDPPQQNTPVRFTNTSTGATSYQWDFGDGESSTEVNPTHLYNETGTFNAVLIAFNPSNCSDTFALTVRTLILPLLDVPNAFTPGRFGINAFISVKGFGIGKMDWKIYNRWGQLVFQTTSRKDSWDGTYKGKLQPMDVYAYTLDVEFTDGKKLRKTGDITLLR